MRSRESGVCRGREALRVTGEDSLRDRTFTPLPRVHLFDTRTSTGDGGAYSSLALSRRSWPRCECAAPRLRRT